MQLCSKHAFKVCGVNWADFFCDKIVLDARIQEVLDEGFSVGMGPNLVRVRKLEFLYRVFEVRRSSKFEPKFASLKFPSF